MHIGGVARFEVEVAPPPSDRRVRAYGRWLPGLTLSFVLINTAMFVVSMFLNNCPKNSLNCFAAGLLGRFAFQPIKENPLVGPSSTTLESMGALDVGKVVHGHQGWRLVTCMWLHGGILHLLANMTSLLILGMRLEQEFGFVRTGLLYLISGFGGSLLSALFLKSEISVGASGAVFGLLGGMLSELITNWSTYYNKVLSLVTLVVFIAINLAVGILPHVDNFAHVGGFLTGFLVGFVLLVRPQPGWITHQYNLPGYPLLLKSRFKTYQCILWIVSFILLVVGLVFALLMLFRGADLNERCSWCHYMNCIPTKKWSCKTEQALCESDEIGDRILLTCVGRNNGTAMAYNLKNPTATVIEGLCTQLCQ